jgi:hypothetical protein
MTKKKNTQKSKENIKRLNGSELADLIGIEPEKYNNFENPITEYNILNPKEIFEDTRIMKIPSNVIETFKPVNEKYFKTGNIYWDGIYELMYLYLGKFNSSKYKLKDLVIGLGGRDELYKGNFEKGLENKKGVFLEGIINKKNIFFEKEIYSPYKNIKK